MSAIEILASGLQDDVGASAAVDVSAHSTLRLNWSALGDLGRSGTQLALVVETGPTSSGPWTALNRIDMAAGHASGPYRWQTSPRVHLGGFDSFVRCRWEGKTSRTAKEADAGTQLFTLALAGDAQPDAA